MINENDISYTNECSVFLPDETISQGTIIKFENKPKDETYGIVVTADCDIAQDKYGKYLSFCYLLPLEIYVHDYLIPKLCTKKIKCLKQKLYSKILKIPEFERISEDAFLDLISYKESTLKDNISDKNLIKEIIDNKKEFSKDSFSLIDYKELCPQSFKNPKELTNIIREFPGDKFYINQIPNVNGYGFVVNLRRIAEIKVSEIQRKYFGSDCKCCAIAKLNSPYKQKMSQALGAMFSDIGLPTEFENIRNQTIEYFVKEEIIK